MTLFELNTLITLAESVNEKLINITMPKHQAYVSQTHTHILLQYHNYCLIKKSFSSASKISVDFDKEHRELLKYEREAILLLQEQRRHDEFLVIERARLAAEEHKQHEAIVFGSVVGLLLVAITFLMSNT